MKTPRRSPASAHRQRRRSPARPVGLGLRHPAGTRPARQRLAQTRKKLDLTQLLTLGAVLVTLALAVPSYITAQSQAHNAEQGQLTDRFSKAVEQLGTPENLEVRLGGIYALERIAHDSARDHPTVMSVLATFVRENTQRLRSPAGHCAEAPPAADVQAALTVLANPHPERDRGRLDLTNACLAKADLHNAYLIGADFAGADLTGASLTNVDLDRADLTSADLTSGRLMAADFAGANLSGTDLNDANLSGTDLNDAYLIGADLTGARLAYASLSGADLYGANLSGAALYDANLANADLTGVDLSGAALNQADLAGAALERMDPEMLRQARTRIVPLSPSR